MSDCLLIQHIATESGFAIESALVSRGVGVDIRQPFSGDRIPSMISDFSGLVIMGGPMSAASDSGFPTRRVELDLIVQAIELGLPVLGVCLGAQLLAVATGGTVFRGGSGPEIGWGHIHLTPESETDPLFTGIPSELNVMHWHGDTFELPLDAIRLASNPTYLNQAFRIGKAAWGFQFHLEVTPDAVDGFLDTFPEEAALVIGGADAIRGATPDALLQLCVSRDMVFDRFAGFVAQSN